MSTLLWALLGGVALLARAVDPRYGMAASQAAISLLTVAFGTSVFWRHGGRQITAAGLYGLATAVFVGLAGLFWWNEQGNDVDPGLHIATAAGFFTTVAMHRLFWRDVTFSQVAAPSERGPASWGMAAGGFTAGAALGLSLAGVTLGATFLGEIIFGGMAVLMVSLLSYRGDRLGIVRSVLVGGVIAVYALTVFTGFGRLLLVALGLVALVPACLRLPGRTVKAFVVVAIGPALTALIYAREQFGVSTYGTALDGSGSVTLPLADFGRLITLHDRGLLPLGHGSTLLVTALFFVPRVLWPAKPPGFGAVLTQILEPRFLDIDLSLAAHLAGEWFYDFGYPGLVLMVLAMGWTLRRIDLFAAARLAAPVTSRRSVVLLSAAVLLLAGVPDLEWVGTFTYWSRTASRLVVPLVLLLVVTYGGGAFRTASRRAQESVDPR